MLRGAFRYEKSVLLGSLGSLTGGLGRGYICSMTAGRTVRYRATADAHSGRGPANRTTGGTIPVVDGRPKMWDADGAWGEMDGWRSACRGVARTRDLWSSSSSSGSGTYLVGAAPRGTMLAGAGASVAVEFSGDLLSVQWVSAMVSGPGRLKSGFIGHSSGRVSPP